MRRSSFHILALCAIGFWGCVVTACFEKAMNHDKLAQPSNVFDVQGGLEIQQVVFYADGFPRLPTHCVCTNTGGAPLLSPKSLSVDAVVIYEESGKQVSPISRFQHVNYGDISVCDCVILHARGDFFTPSIGGWRVERDNEGIVLYGDAYQWKLRPGTYSARIVIPEIVTLRTTTGKPASIEKAFGERTRSVKMTSNPIVFHVK